MGKWDNLNFRKAENAEAWDYKTQPEIMGELMSIQENVGPNNSMMYELELDETDKATGLAVRRSVWGSTVLNTRLKNVKVGEIVKIKYLGQKKSESRKGAQYHDFEVFHAMPEDLDPSKVFDGNLPEA